MKLTQSGVGPAFKMAVPVYMQLADGRVMRFGAVAMIGTTTFDHTFNLPRLPSPIKKVMINYYYDVLSIEN